MECLTGEVVVVGYGCYQKNVQEGGGDMTRRDGSAVEYVELVDPESHAMDEGVRRFTLDRSINGSRPEPGSTARLRLRDWIEPDAAIGRDGRPYVCRKHKTLVLGFGNVVAPK